MVGHLPLRVLFAAYLILHPGWAVLAWADALQTTAACFIPSPEYPNGALDGTQPDNTQLNSTQLDSAQRSPTMVQLEVADTTEARSTGLMHRKHLADDAGMLFVFPSQRAGHTGFWMYKTLIPLDIAFLNDDGYIARVLSMVPCPHHRPRQCRSYRPDVPYSQAVEMNAGFFDRHRLREGDRLLIGETCLSEAAPGQTDPSS